MIKAIQTFLRIMHSSDDNTNYEVIRVLSSFSVIVVLFNATYSTVVLKSWNPAEFGIGLAAVLAAVGAAIRWKENAPQPNAPAMEVKAQTIQSVSTEAPKS